MSNVINFPTGKITVEELLAEVTERVKNGEIRHMMFVTMGHETQVNVGMTTVPAFEAMYMNQYQRMRIESLMRSNGVFSES